MYEFPTFFKEGWHDVLSHDGVVRPFVGKPFFFPATAQILSRATKKNIIYSGSA